MRAVGTKDGMSKNETWISRRVLVKSLAFLGLMAGVSVNHLALAQGATEYPQKPIKLIVPYPPGGATDVIGRAMAMRLSTALNQQVVVDNRAGATGSIGAAAVASATPDGYTILMGALTSHTISGILAGSKATFDINKSFAPVALVGVVPLVFVVNPEVKANSLAELIALAKSKPGQITFASSGNGSPQHLAGELFQRVAGVKMLHVPYKGSGPAMTDLIAGQVQTMIETAPAAQSHIKSGKLRALATASLAPISTLPEIPTADKSGLKGFEVNSKFGILAPAGTPPAIVNKLSDAVRDILSQPEAKESLLQQGALASYANPSETAKLLKAESDRWSKVIKDAKVTAE